MHLDLPPIGFGQLREGVAIERAAFDVIGRDGGAV
jgi:hypothetical protein